MAETTNLPFINLENIINLLKSNFFVSSVFQQFILHAKPCSYKWKQNNRQFTVPLWDKYNFYYIHPRNETSVNKNTILKDLFVVTKVIVLYLCLLHVNFICSWCILCMCNIFIIKEFYDVCLVLIELPGKEEVRVLVFNSTFNNISVISWQSVLLVEKMGIQRENHRSGASHWQTLSHSIVSSTPLLNRIWTHWVIGTDCRGTCSYKSYYQTITTTMALPCKD